MATVPWHENQAFAKQKWFGVVRCNKNVFAVRRNIFLQTSGRAEGDVQPSEPNSADKYPDRVP